MPTSATAQDATDRQRLMSERLGEYGPVGRFIALRRRPGEDWTQLETIAHQLYSQTHLPVTRSGLTKWMAHYGIPPTTPRATAEEIREYDEAVKHLLRRS